MPLGCQSLDSALCGSAILSCKEPVPRFACESRHFLGTGQQALDAQITINLLPVNTVVQNLHVIAFLDSCQEKRGHMLQWHKHGNPCIKPDPQVSRIDFRFKNFWRQIHRWY